jgi:RNA polymerase sigma-70 factor (ECF subfamily)
VSSSPEEYVQPSPLVKDWLVAARCGSADALGRVLEICRQYLLLIANQKLEAELRGKIGASDIVQDTFLEAQRDFGRFQGRTEEELLAWLRRILLNNLANVTRHYRDTEKRRIAREIHLTAAPPAELANGLIAPCQSPGSVLLAGEQDETLHRAVDRLPEPARQVIHWRNYDRLPFEEIGRRLDRSAEAARKVWVRALEQLEALLGPLDASS